MRMQSEERKGFEFVRAAHRRKLKLKRDKDLFDAKANSARKFIYDTLKDIREKFRRKSDFLPQLEFDEKLKRNNYYICNDDCKICTK